MALNFLAYSGDIAQIAVDALERYRNAVSPVSQKIINHLKEFSIRGKMMRGCLVVHSASKFGVTDRSLALKAAAAVELLHSGILIIDDIIDRDEKRRGLPAMHLLLRNEFLEGAYHGSVTGEDFAMAAGLTASYIGFYLLNELPGKVLELVANSFALTGLAEIKELYVSVGSDFSEDAVLDIYKLKTGKYSISAPISAGAVLAGKNDLLPLIEKAGDYAGIAFQIKDDIIELNYGEEVTGKPVFSDLMAGRKNLAVVLAYRTASAEEKKRLAAIFEKGGAKESTDLEFILELFRKYEIQKELEQKLEEAGKRALAAAAKSPVLKGIFEELLEFNRARQR